jgi:transcriptional regulator
MTAHAYGRPDVIEVLADPTKIYERGEGWSLDALPPGNAAAQTKGIVAFRMKLTKIEAKTSSARTASWKTARA